MALSIEILGLDKLVRDVAKAGGDANNLMKAAIVNSVNKIQSNTRSRAARRTGTLQRSILTQVNYPVGQVKVHEKYGVFLEEGTGIYGQKGREITPKQAKVLAFKVGGQQVFTKKVKGIKARPFFRPGIEASADYIAEQFVKVIERLTSGLAGKGF